MPGSFRAGLAIGIGALRLLRGRTFPMHGLLTWPRILGLTVGCFCWMAPAAAEVALTGFATLGYARSDRDFRYLRYIDDGGTFRADSLLGAQAEARFNSKWGATVQAVASAPRRHDEGYEAEIRWAFVSYRPNNDWLFRVGRVRPPVLINTQNSEVGVTYDQVRLPVEVYSLSPVYDIDGATVTRTWGLRDSEFSVDGYWGKSDIAFRLPFQRDPAARTSPQFVSFFPSGQYLPEKITFKGAVLSYGSNGLLLRAGAHRADLKPGLDAPFVDTFQPAAFPAPAPFGGTLYQPVTIDKIKITALTLGVDWRLADWRITAEYGQRDIKGTSIGVASKSAYATVARNVGKWTPYATYARLLSDPQTRRLYTEVNGTPVPLGAQGPPLLLPPNYHQILADFITVYDQYSSMLGASYSFSATSKLKFEWMRTKIGLRSALVDSAAQNTEFNVLSVSYSVVF